MKHYYDYIPPTLAEKLKEKGMPITMSNHLYQPAPNVKGLVQANFKELDCLSYAEVFDWLMERGQRVHIIKSKSGAELWQGRVSDTLNTLYYDTWLVAANRAIEKALTLFKR